MPNLCLSSSEEGITCARTAEYEIPRELVAKDSCDTELHPGDVNVNVQSTYSLSGKSFQ